MRGFSDFFYFDFEVLTRLEITSTDFVVEWFDRLFVGSFPINVVLKIYEWFASLPLFFLILPFTAMFRRSFCFASVPSCCAPCPSSRQSRRSFDGHQVLRCASRRDHRHGRRRRARRCRVRFPRRSQLRGGVCYPEIAVKAVGGLKGYRPQNAGGAPRVLRTVECRVFVACGAPCDQKYVQNPQR